MGRKHCAKRRNCSLRAISPFPSVFKRLVSQGHQKESLCGNGLNDLPGKIHNMDELKPSLSDVWIFFSEIQVTLSQISPGFLRVCHKSLLLITNSPFTSVFSTCLKNFLPLSLNLKLSSAKSFNLEEFKICHLGNG